MAEFLRRQLLPGHVWAIIPSLLYYVACFGAVHFEAKRRGLHGVPRPRCPRLGDVMRERGHLFIPVLIILGGMFTGYARRCAALAARSPASRSRCCAQTRAGSRWRIRCGTRWSTAPRTRSSVALACACAGIIIGVIALTGLGITFTQVVLGARAEQPAARADRSPASPASCSAWACRRRRPTSSWSSLLVPALIKLGVVDAGRAHVRVLLRDPVGDHAAGGARGVRRRRRSPSPICGRRAGPRCSIGAAGFIVPFMFVYEPALLMIGTWPEIIAPRRAPRRLLLLAAGLHGYLLRPARVGARRAGRRRARA